MPITRAIVGSRRALAPLLGSIGLPSSPSSVTLILGGARSGKSAHAETLVLASGLRPIYLATAQALDGEMAERIARHRAQRGTVWHTVEEPLDLPEALSEHAGPDCAVLVDCLTLWLSNLMLAERDIARAGDHLLEVLRRRTGPVVLVSNEVGQGIVPLGELSRRFVDEAGRLHQQIAALADHVRLIVAGLPLDLKPLPARPSCTS